ncbi:MAG TPA: coproporphyrinogen-III oxidase family protein [Gemmatimonadaceae bacterium]|nr:coproporphyrinogen-III oxidase family protein [Gemmatimonadaceae bacterium]
MPYPRHVYVHVPFCARRCSYCDFSIAVRAAVPVDEYIGSVRRELAIRYPVEAPISAGDPDPRTRLPGGPRALTADLKREWPVETLYLGGGTPSRLGAAGVTRLLACLRSHMTLEPNAEVTLEANPDDVEPDAVQAWRDAGITRLSIGAQSFDDGVLAWMHRTHDARAIHAAVGALRDAGFTDYSLDLIFALPTAVPRDWGRDLETAIALGPTHVSLYGLTVEPLTPLGRRRARGELDEAPEERYEADYLAAHRTLRAAGFEHYEVSNFGRPGHRARHNSAYWSDVPYAGVGPAAHEYTGSVRRWNVAPYVEWCRRLAEGLDPMGGSELLEPGSRLAEEVYLGLRTAAGLVIKHGEGRLVDPWVAAGWGTIHDGSRLVLNERGWLRLDALAAALTHFRSHL